MYIIYSGKHRETIVTLRDWLKNGASLCRQIISKTGKTKRNLFAHATYLLGVLISTMGGVLCPL